MGSWCESQDNYQTKFDNAASQKNVKLKTKSVKPERKTEKF